MRGWYAEKFRSQERTYSPKKIIVYFWRAFPFANLFYFLSCYGNQSVVCMIYVQVQKSETLVEQDPVSTMQKTGEANYSSFLEWKRVPPWVWSLGGSLQPSTDRTNDQPGDPSPRQYDAECVKYRHFKCSCSRESNLAKISKNSTLVFIKVIVSTEGF